MSKNIWIIANWKSNKTIVEALEWIDEVGPQLPKKENLQIVVCPSFTAISDVKKAAVVGNFPILLGAQNISPFTEGAYTGEVSSAQLKDLVSLAIIGHSERRENFAETDRLIEEKVKLARESSLTPLLCVQNEATPVPEGVKLLAYEPVFAIGTGHPDTPENAGSVAAKLKERLVEGAEILYGGSVTSDNAKAFLQQENINGLLVGGASLSPEKFVKIVATTSQI